MIGRDGEIGLIDGVIAAGRSGRSGALLITGDPGIGKTALLAHARRAAGAALVLEFAGSEAESRLTFAGLAGLLEPVIADVEGIPEPQARALAAAIGRGEPVPGGGDRFTIYAAALSALAFLADRGTVICLVDDAHWLDDESLEALLFIARRLRAESVVLLLAAREGVSTRIDASTLPRLRLSGLGGEDALRLVARHASTGASTRVLRQLVAGAGGNPLALTELATRLSPGQLAGTEPLPDPLPVGPYLQAALLRPLDELPERTRQALVVASADGGAGAFLSAALAELKITPGDLEPAERSGVIVLGPTHAEFSHPLLRSAVYQAASAPDRRAAHRAHAAAARAFGDAAALDRRAWHLALASPGPDADAAAELEAAAARASARGAHGAACEALEAAGRLSPDPPGRGRRLGAAAVSAMAAGLFERAAALADEVVALGADPAQALEARVVRGHAEMWGGSTRRAVGMLVAAAESAADAAPLAAAEVFCQASLGAMMRAETSRARALARQAADLADAAGADAVERAVVDAALASAITYDGGRAAVDPGLDGRLVAKAVAGDPAAYFWAVNTQILRMVQEDYEDTLERIDAFVGTVRAQVTPSMLPYTLTFRADLLMRMGRLREARGDGVEGVEMAAQMGFRGVLGYGHGVLARVEALLGDADACREHAVATLNEVADSEAASLTVYADAALGALLLAQGDIDDAVRHLVAAQERGSAGGRAHPLLVPFAGDLVEGLIRLGRREEAEAALADLDARAAATGASWAEGVVHRCRGLLAPDDDVEEHFARALDVHARTPTPLESARTLLCLGERRRRARRMRDAREPLTEALRIFDEAGARAWAEWARRELRAAGGRPGESARDDVADLTPQELRVALAVAAGATNKEAAAALLISPKTVEYHLGRAYAKLGVRSRSQLTARIATTSPPDDRAVAVD